MRRLNGPVAWLSAPLLVVSAGLGACYAFDRQPDVPGGAISGTALRVDGDARGPAPFARVEAPGTLRVRRAGDDGKFQLDGLPVGIFVGRLLDDENGDGRPERAALVGARIRPSPFDEDVTGVGGVLLGDVELQGPMSVGGSVLLDDGAGTLVSPTALGLRARVYLFRDLCFDFSGDAFAATGAVSCGGVTDDPSRVVLGAEASTAADSTGAYLFPEVLSGEVALVTLLYQGENDVDGALVSVSAALRGTANAGQSLALDVEFPAAPPPPAEHDVQVEIQNAGGLSENAFLLASPANAPLPDCDDPAAATATFNNVPGNNVQIRLLEGAWNVAACDGDAFGLLVEQLVHPGEDLFAFGPLLLEEDDPCLRRVNTDDGTVEIRDCDGDDLVGLPPLDADNLDPDALALWVACGNDACNAARGEGLGGLTCTVGAAVYDCDDDGDEQADSTEHPDCYGLLRGSDLDGDALCAPSDPYPQCAQNDPVLCVAGENDVNPQPFLGNLAWRDEAPLPSGLFVRDIAFDATGVPVVLLGADVPEALLRLDGDNPVSIDLLGQGFSPSAGMVLSSSDRRLALLGGEFPSSAPVFELDAQSDLGFEVYLNTSDVLVQAQLSPTATFLNNDQVLVAGGSAPETFAPLGLGVVITFLTPGEAAYAPLDLAAPRFSHTATHLGGGRVLLVGGFGADFAPLLSVEVVDAENLTTAEAAPLGRGRIGHTATFVPATGDVVVIGGGDNNSAATTIEALAVGVDGSSWRVLTDQAPPLLAHTATLLPDDAPVAAGQIFVVGGLSDPDGEGPPLRSTFFVDPVDGSIAPGPDLTTGRAGHGAAYVAATQSILVVGGSGDGEASLRSVERLALAGEGEGEGEGEDVGEPCGTVINLGIDAARGVGIGPRDDYVFARDATITAFRSENGNTTQRNAYENLDNLPSGNEQVLSVNTEGNVMTLAGGEAQRPTTTSPVWIVDFSDANPLGIDPIITRYDLESDLDLRQLLGDASGPLSSQEARVFFNQVVVIEKHTNSLVVVQNDKNGLRAVAAYTNGEGAPLRSLVILGGVAFVVSVNTREVLSFDVDGAVGVLTPVSRVRAEASGANLRMSLLTLSGAPRLVTYGDSGRSDVLVAKGALVALEGTTDAFGRGNRQVRSLVQRGEFIYSGLVDSAGRRTLGVAVTPQLDPPAAIGFVGLEGLQSDLTATAVHPTVPQLVIANELEDARVIDLSSCENLLN